MLKQIKEVQDAWRATQRTLDIKVVVNDKTYRATDINSLKYDSGAYTGDTFSIGSTYSNNVQIEFSHLVEGLKLGMEVRPSIGIKTSKGYIYEPLGVFIISSEIKMDRNNNLTSISASDRFCGLEGTYKSKLAYPARVLDIIAEICAQSGVKANVDDLSRLPHQADLPSAITGQTYRKALGWIAQLYAGYATFDRHGLFTIRTIAEPNYELDPSQYEQAGLTKNEAPYKISGIQCQTTITTKTRDGEDTDETKTYQVGDTNGPQIKLENNIMTPDRLTNIWEQLKDVTFYPFSLNWFGNPAIEAGDWLKLQDKQGNKFIVPNNSYTLDFNGGLSATSKADQTSSTDSGIAWEGTFSQTIRELQGRKAPDGTVIFPPSVTEPPTNAKPNDVWFKQNGNSTELWVFTEQEDGTGKWIRRDLTSDEIKKQVQEAQSGLNDAKKQIADNLAKADGDIAELNASIRDQKKAFDTDIDELNASIRDQKGTIDGLSTTINTVAIPKITDVTNKVSDALTKINDQKNIVTGLQTQSAQQGKDISKITTDIHGVSVDLANLNGDVNQTKVTVQGLQSTLGNAQGDIAQIKVDAKKLETSLSGKVDNSTYASFVSATNNALNAKLVASDLRGYAKTTDVQATANGLQVNINNISDRMNNLKIGAENLLNNTDNLVNYQTNNNGQIQNITKSNYIPLILNHPELTHMAHVWKDWQSVYSNQEVILEKDKPYWFGFYICTDAFNRSPFGNISVLGIKKGSDLAHSKVFIEQNTENYSYFGGASKHWVWHTYKIIGDGGIYSGIRVEGSKSTGSSAYFAGYTLVQSDMAPTGYINSLDSTKHEISQLSAQITANNQKFSSYYTKVEADSKTNIAKNEAINTIKNDSNWHGLNNILTNSGFLQTSDGFTQKVQQTTKPILDSANSGGVNLLANTYNFSGFTSEQKGKWNFDPQSSYSNNAGYALIKTMVAHIYGNSWNNSKLNFNQTIYLPAGKYIFSFLASVNSNQNNSFSLKLTANVNGVNKVLQGDSGVITYSWKAHTMEFALAENSIISNIQLYNSSNTALPGGSIYFANLKLESGSLATTWCPAPEDYATQTSFSELNQTVKGLQTTVSNNRTNLQSQISQTAGTIRSEVTNKTNNLQSQINQNANNFNIRLNDKVSKNKILAQINVASGTTLIQNEKIYMDASSTVFSGKAFIPNAAITNISADKINAGTLDAGRINVINLNANNITTGTINGANLKINLNDGNVEFQQGRIHNWNNTIDININQNYISTANYDTRAILKDGELQLVQPGLFDKSSDPYLRIHNWLTGSSFATGVIEARNGITINQKKYEATSIFDNKGYTNTWAGFYTGTSDYTHELLTAIGGANKGVIIHGGTYYKGALNSQNVPRILVGSSMDGDHLGDNRIRIEADYVHIPSVNAKTTGSAPNVYVAPDGALVRSTLASKYKTNIQRSYSTEYGDKLLNLPTAIWTDKGQKERYEAGKRHIKPEKYFGMIAEDLADAGLDLLVSRNPQTHEIEGIQYERIAPALLPVLKELKDKVNRLEKKVNE